MRDPLLERCRLTIRDGSKSFAAAARLFAPETRAAAYQLYAWCRYCDDQIDGESLGRRPAGRAAEAEGARHACLSRLVADTRRTLAGSPPADPVYEALDRVVRRYDIPARLPLELIEGFAMDAEGRRYDGLDDLLLYCYHVAGTVGLMMAHVMGVRDEGTLRRAADLGIALQLTNIARDVIDDARAGRVYLPLRWLEAAEVPTDAIEDPRHRAGLASVVRRVLREADRYYASGDRGLCRLPLRSAWSVAVARGVYSEIGRLVTARGAEAWDRRAVVSRPRKLYWVGRGLVDALYQVTVSRRLRERPRPDLWTKQPSLD
ncbi:MAG: phytoene/squalene synthase family protein [Vicinamibacteria bacterium]